MLKERAENILHKTKRGSWAGVITISSIFAPVVNARAQPVQYEMSPPYCPGQAVDNTVIQSTKIEKHPISSQNPEIIFSNQHNNINSSNTKSLNAIEPDFTTNPRTIKVYEHQKYFRKSKLKYKLHINPEVLSPTVELKTTREIQAFVRNAIDDMWDDSQWPPTYDIVYCESRWNPTAGSKSGPYGLFQLWGKLNGNYSIPHQVLEAENYIKDVYDDPTGAWTHWKRWSSY